LSESDSFIGEVTDEVRRDKLFAFFRKYLWVFIGIVVLIVGGAAVNEYLKNRATTEAQARGEALSAAELTATAEAFAPLASDGSGGAVIAKMGEAGALIANGKSQEAAAIFAEISADTAYPQIYRDLALLKMVMVNGANMPQSEVFDVLDKLAAPGAPFNLLAMEQRAVANVRNGDIEAARADLVLILVDPGATQGLRNRVQQLTIALGGAPTPAGV